MNAKRIRQLILVGGVIAATCMAMAYSGGRMGSSTQSAAVLSGANGTLTLSGHLTRDKIDAGGDGIVSLALDIRAQEKDGPVDEQAGRQHVDMVLVLDRSGSMSGRKIEDARNAALRLIQDLSPRDRLALVVYSDRATVCSGLTGVTEPSGGHLSDIVRRISANGGTNLSEGLQEGIRILSRRPPSENLGRLILISDGLANHGITDTTALGDMAAAATEFGFSISTAGVGYDFNEQLMTAIADRGAGTYHFLEDPADVASLFRKELHHARQAAASRVTLRVPERNGIRLASAGGYPLVREGGAAVLYPGDIGFGENRRIFLDFHVPAGREAVYEIEGIEISYDHEGRRYTAALPGPLRVACVVDPEEAIASIDAQTWAAKVLTEDFNRLREEVAGDIKGGREKEAMARIEAYRTRQSALNGAVNSPAVARNLEGGLNELRDSVAETFSGDRDAVAEKRKKHSKALQFKGYRERRMHYEW
jgi:Ca-activated chloride channel family protein